MSDYIAKGREGVKKGREGRGFNTPVRSLERRVFGRFVSRRDFDSSLEVFFFPFTLRLPLLRRRARC